jgi:hypothetical protein
MRNSGRGRISGERRTHYPGADIEALAPRSLDKRIAAEWLRQCYVEKEPLDLADTAAPAIPGLTIYAQPQLNRRLSATSLVVARDSGG